MTALTWNTAPLDTPLWAVYGHAFCQVVTPCVLRQDYEGGRAIWGWSLHQEGREFKLTGAYRTLGHGRAWAEDNHLLLFSLRSDAIEHLTRVVRGMVVSNDPVTYTLEQLDAAIVAISGPAAVRRGPSWCRPHAMHDAARDAWIKGYPEDEHTAVLRAAFADLNKDGWLRPQGGWPEDKS